MIKLIDILIESEERDLQKLDILLYKWINYAGSYDTLSQIEELSKKLKLNTPPKNNIVYRVVPMVGEDIKNYPPEEIIKIDRENKIVSTTTNREMIGYFSEGADWSYIITYKPHTILNFDELEKKYHWKGDIGEDEVLIDAQKSKVLDIKLLDSLKEMYPPYKADMVSKVRYKASDTFTNNRKLATRKGYLEGDRVGKAAPYGSGFKKIKEALSSGLTVGDNGKIDLAKSITDLEQLNQYIKALGSNTPLIFREAKYKQHHIINKLTTGDRNKYRGMTLGGKTVLDELGVEDPVFATFKRGVGIFGNNYVVILKDPYKIYQSDKVFDLAVDTNPVQYKETNKNGSLSRSQTGILTKEEEIAKGKELAKTYKVATDIKPLPGKEGWEIIIDTPEYYMVSPAILINLAGKFSGYQVKDANNFKTYGELSELMNKLIGYWKWTLKNKK